MNTELFIFQKHCLDTLMRFPLGQNTFNVAQPLTPWCSSESETLFLFHNGQMPWMTIFSVGKFWLIFWRMDSSESVLAENGSSYVSSSEGAWYCTLSDSCMMHWFRPPFQCYSVKQEKASHKVNKSQLTLKRALLLCSLTLTCQSTC